jgi:NTP pyrophosphatase (non-canonical NTP hydrolase)
MTLPFNGLFKLCEECGELVQSAAKLLPYGPTPNLNPRKNLQAKLKSLENEIADLLAVIDQVIIALNLDQQRISARKGSKIKRYSRWVPPA